jgi:hypothetical protein
MVLCYVSWRLFETYDDVAQSLQHSAYIQNLTGEYCLALALFVIISYWPFSLIFVSKEEADLKGTINVTMLRVRFLKRLCWISLSLMLLYCVSWHLFDTYDDITQLL